MLIKKISTLIFNQTLASFSLSYYNKKISPSTQRYSILHKKIRSTTSLRDAVNAVQSNLQQIQAIGKTLVLEFFNQFNMQQKQKYDIQSFRKIFTFINKLQGLSFYELSIKLSIYEKIINFLIQEDKQKQKYQIPIDQCVQQIIEYVDKNQMDLFNGFNILVIFRIQKHTKLTQKALQIINHKIIEYQTHFKTVRVFSIILHQLEYIPWQILRKYENIIRFFTYNYHLHQSLHYDDYESLIIIFNNVCKLQWHKVGLKKIPIILKQIIQVISSQVDNIPLHLIFSLVDSLALLPSTFQPQFQHAVIQRLYKNPKCPLIHSKFPYAGLTIANIDHFFSIKQNCSILWSDILYYTEPHRMPKFMRGVIVKYFEQLIDNILCEPRYTKDKNQQSSKTSAKCCHLAIYFYQHNRMDVVQKLKQILLRYLTNTDLLKILDQFSLLNFITLFTLFEKNQDLLLKINQAFQLIKNRRKNRNKFNKYIQNALITIEFHIQNKSKIGRKYVLQCIQQMLENNDTKFSFNLDSRILIAIINAKQCPQYKVIKEKLYNKMNKQDIQCLADYYILNPLHSLQGIRQIMKKLIQIDLSSMKLEPNLSQKCLESNSIWSDQYNCNFDMDKKIIANKDDDEVKKRILPKACTTRLQKFYRFFDTENKGYVNIENLKQILGDFCTQKQILMLFQNSDADKDGKLTLKQFARVLLPSDLQIEGLM